ncbi:phospholipase-like protein [Tanacetum coccineum]
MWDKFYKRTINVVARHRGHHLAEKKKTLNFNAIYNLYDFAWAFKIWILETYPNSKIWWSKNKNVLPRGLGWTKISKFEKSDYNRLFIPVSIRNVDLYSTPAEQREPWFIASIPFINGLVDEDRNVFIDDCVGVSKDNDVDGQHQLGYENERVNETLVEKNDRLLLEEGDGVLDSKRGGRNHESDNVKQPKNVSIAELFAEVRALRQEVALIKTKPDMISNHSKDIQNYCVPDVTSNHTSVDQGLNVDNAKFACDGMSIDKADRKNEYTYSQANTSTLDILIKAFDYSNDHPEIDVLRDANDVHRSVPNLNHHATPEPVHVYDFADDYMNVLNDEETVANYSLDDMKLQDEEDNLTVKEILVEHQPVDELINPKYVNVVKDDYKPPLASVFTCAKSKTKKCGIRKNYVLRSVEERMNKLAMDLDSPFGQQGTATPAPPKTRSMSSIGDTIVAPDFEEYNTCYVENSNACLDKAKEGWLQDSHLDLWVDLMWYFREPDADWAMVNLHFLPCILGGSIPDYYSNGVTYPVSWRDVEKVYFPINKPKKHWCLAKLQISAGVVTFYDSLGWVSGNRRP